MVATAGSPANEPACSLILVTHNSARDLPALVDSIGPALGGRRCHTIVVDNASSDDTVDLARAHAAVDVVVPGANRGYAGGINAGRHHAVAGRPIVIANPDLAFRPGALERMLVELEAPGVGAVVCRLETPDGITQHSLRREPSLLRAVGDSLFGSSVAGRPAWSTEDVDDAATYERSHDVEWATGAAWAVSDDCDRRVGPWDERYFMYSEEVDYACRIRSAGLRIRYVADAAAVHHHEGGSGRNATLRALLELNRVRYYRRHHGRVATAAFRCAVGLRGALRLWKPEDRNAALVAMGLRPPPQFPGAERIEGVPW